MMRRLSACLLSGCQRRLANRVRCRFVWRFANHNALWCYFGNFHCQVGQVPTSAMVCLGHVRCRFCIAQQLERRQFTFTIHRLSNIYGHWYGDSNDINCVPSTVPNSRETQCKRLRVLYVLQISFTGVSWLSFFIVYLSHAYRSGESLQGGRFSRMNCQDDFLPSSSIISPEALQLHIRLSLLFGTYPNHLSAPFR